MDGSDICLIKADCIDLIGFVMMIVASSAGIMGATGVMGATGTMGITGTMGSITKSDQTTRLSNLDPASRPSLFELPASVIVSVLGPTIPSTS